MSTMIRSLFLFLILIASGVSAASTAKISGVFPGTGLKTVYLISISDYLSGHEEILASCQADPGGKFALETHTREVRACRIQVGHYSADFYISPECDLTLRSDTLHFDDHYKSFLEYEYLDFDIRGYDPSGLNRKIRELNTVINEFVLDHFSGNLRRLKKELMDTLRLQTSRFMGDSNEFIRVYREYKIAGIELAVYGSGKTDLFRDYLWKRDIQYNNPEFMDFFNQFFRNYLLDASQVIPYTDIIYTVNNLADYRALDDSTGKDTLLRNEVLREYVLLKQLREWYYNPDFIRENIMNILSQIKAKSKFPEHIAAAGNLMEGLSLFSRGGELPSFSLPDTADKIFYSGELEKKCTYLCFVNIESPASWYELEHMLEFREKFKDSVGFVVISLDPDRELFNEFARQQSPGVKFLYNGEDYPFIQRFRLSTLPVFMLLDGNLEIISYPAAKPSEGVEDQIRFLLNSDRGK